MTPVVLTEHEQIEQAIVEALGHLQLEPLVRDKVVAVKPNDTWASAEDTTAVTQPDTLRAVLRYVKQFSPKELIVTGGSGAGQTDEIFQVAGLMAVVQEEGATFLTIIVVLSRRCRSHMLPTRMLPVHSAPSWSIRAF